MVESFPGSMLLSPANANEINHSLTAATNDDALPSRSFLGMICSQCNDESIPSTTTTPSQPRRQQQDEDEENTATTPSPEEVGAPMKGSSHISERNDDHFLSSSSLQAKKQAASWRRSEGNPNTASMMIGDPFAVVDLKVHEVRNHDDDGGGTIQTTKHIVGGGETRRITNSSGDCVRMQDSGKDHDDINSKIRVNGGNNDDAAEAIEAMMALASPTTSRSTAVIKSLLSSSSPALQALQCEYGSEEEEGNKKIQSSTEMKVTENNGKVKGGGDEEKGGGKVNGRPRAIKTLATVRKKYEQNNLQSNSLATCNITTSTYPPISLEPPPPPNPPNTTTSTSTIEFLKPQKATDGKKDLYQRVSFAGDIMSQIHAIPSTYGKIGLGNDPKEKHIFYPASLEAMNGVYPTMAAPYMPLRQDTSSNEKKGKKRGHEKISMASKESILSGKSSSEPKNKRSRGDKKSNGKSKSTSIGASASRLATDNHRANIDATNPLPPSPIRILHPPKNTNTMVRTLPDFTSQPQQYTITSDHRPHRIYNPLLQLPQFPDENDPPLDEIPQAGELWNISDIHFHDPDTYPISYLARVLGFHVPVDGCGQEFGQAFDPMSLERCNEEGEQDVMTIPERGSFCDRIWKGPHLDKKNVHGNVVNSFLAIASSSSRGIDDNDHGMHDDRKLTYSDPLYTTILSSYRGYNDNDFKDAGKGYLDEISPHCLEFARQRGVLGNNNNLSFRFGSEIDEETLSSLAEKVSSNVC